MQLCQILQLGTAHSYIAHVVENYDDILEPYLLITTSLVLNLYFDSRWYFVYGDFQLQNFVIDTDGFMGIVDAKDIGLVDLDQHPPRMYYS